MALDINKIRQRLEEAKGNGTKSNGTYFWRPQDGTQDIRIISPEDGDPFKDFWFHYNVGNNPGFLSPKKNFGEEDPLNDFVRKLFNEGTEESIKMAKSLMARQRFFSPVLVRGEEDKGVRIWGYGKTAYENLLSLVLNPEYGDITDTESGTDLTLTYGKPPGASFPQTKLVPRRRSSALCEDLTPDKCAELLDSIPEFGGLFERKTTADVQTMLDNFVNSQVDDPESVSSETTKYGNKNNDSEVNAVDAAFAELGAL